MKNDLSEVILNKGVRFAPTSPMLKISLNTNAKNQNYKNIYGIVEKSMRTIQLKSFNAIVKHEIIESNKETFNERLN